MALIFALVALHGGGLDVGEDEIHARSLLKSPKLGSGHGKVGAGSQVDLFAVDHVKLEVKLAADTMVVVRLALLLIAMLAVGVSLLALDALGFCLIRRDLAIGADLENCAAETRRDS